MSNIIPRDVRFEYYKSPQFRGCEPGSVSWKHLQETEPDGNLKSLDFQDAHHAMIKVDNPDTFTGNIQILPAYKQPLSVMLKSLSDTEKIKYPFYFAQGDSRGEAGFRYPVYSKSRQHIISSVNEWNQLHVRDLNLEPGSIFPHQATLLKCFNDVRHWKENGDTQSQVVKLSVDYQRTLYKLNQIKFKNKIDKAVWRGCTTCAWVPVRSSQRFLLVNKYYNDNNVDVAYSKVLPTHAQQAPEIRKLTRHPITTEYIRYKYLISIHGNDKDSGLNWKLQTDSVVLMPKPYIESWLMEGLLQPNVHYVQLKDDLSDLNEKIQWCRDNQSACEEISHNSTEFMKQFFDHKQESQLQRDLLVWGTNLVNHD